MPEPELPKHPGEFVTPLTDKPAEIPKLEHRPGQGVQAEYLPLAVGRARSLGEMAKDWVFFSPAILHIVGQSVFERVLQDYRNQKNDRAPFRLLLAEGPLFRGLDEATGDRSGAGWNRALAAIERERWLEYSAFVISATFVDRGQLIRVAEGSVTIPDPLSAARRDVALPIEISYFGLDGPAGCIALYQPQPEHSPHLHQFCTLEESRVFRQAFWAGRNPHLAIERWRNENQIRVPGERPGS